MATHAERIRQWRIDAKEEASADGIAPDSEAEQQFVRQYIKEQKEAYQRREEQKEEEAKREKEEAKQEAIRQRQLQEEEAKRQREEEAKHKRDMEKREQDRLDREQDRLDREAEARLTSIREGSSGLSTPAGGMNSAPKAPRIPPPKTYNPQEERIDEFFHRFEHAATRHQWDEPTKLSHLQGALPPSELKRIDQMPQDRQNSYKDIKDFFLRIHAITTKKRREDFREHQPTKNDLPSWYAAELTRKFDLWIESAEIEKDYDSIRDFLILDQMRSNLPPHLLTVLEEKKALNPTEAGEVLDAYFRCRPQLTLARVCQSSTEKTTRLSTEPKSTHKNEAKDKNNWRRSSNDQQPYRPPQVRSFVPAPSSNHNGSYNKGSNNPSTPADTTPGDYHAPRQYGNRPSGRQGNSYQSHPASPSKDISSNSRYSQQKQPSPRPANSGGCEVHGPNSAHTTAECRQLQSWRTPPSSPSKSSASYQQPPEPEEVRNAAVVLSAQEDPVTADRNRETVPKAQVKTCNGILDNQKVTVLLDNGSDSIFVARKFVTTKSYTGQKMTTRTAAGPISGCPVAAVNFKCPYLQRGANRVVVLDDPPYDVLLGRIPGTLPFEDKGNNYVAPNVFYRNIHNSSSVNLI